MGSSKWSLASSIVWAIEWNGCALMNMVFSYLNRRKQKRHPVVPCGMEHNVMETLQVGSNWAVHIWRGLFFVISQQYSAILYMELVRFLYVENALMAAFHNNKTKQ